MANLKATHVYDGLTKAQRYALIGEYLDTLDEDELKELAREKLERDYDAVPGMDINDYNNNEELILAWQARQEG